MSYRMDTFGHIRNPFVALLKSSGSFVIVYDMKLIRHKYKVVRVPLLRAIKQAAGQRQSELSVTNRGCLGPALIF